MAEVRAVIDVGTNSVKVLIASVDGSIIRPIEEGSEQTRLGQGFYENHMLRPGPIEQTAAAVAEFAAQAKSWKPVSLRVVATSAARDAANAEELIEAIERKSGLRVEVITGEQEADWAFEGVSSDPALGSQPILAVDIGGGSTEFMAGRKGERLFGRSFKLGTVRFLERNSLSDPPAPGELLKCLAETRATLEQEVWPLLHPVLESLGEPVQFVASGGTSTIMARIHRRLRSFNRELIDGATMTRAEVRSMVEQLWGIRLEARKNLIGLPAKRADVILPGVAIVDQMLEVFHLDLMRVSTRGLRFGALMH